MKRFVSFFLAVILAFSLTACASDPLDRQLMLSQASLSELQEELADRLAEEEEKPPSRVPDKQDAADGEENLAASLKDRVAGDAAPDAGSTDAPPAGNGTSGQSDSPPSEAEVEPETEPEPDSVTVYVTKSGEKYHRDGCQYLRKSRIETTLSSAQARGYTACSKCNPPV